MDALAYIPLAYIAFLLLLGYAGKSFYKIQLQNKYNKKKKKYTK